MKRVLLLLAMVVMMFSVSDLAAQGSAGTRAVVRVVDRGNAVVRNVLGRTVERVRLFGHRARSVSRVRSYGCGGSAATTTFISSVPETMQSSPCPNGLCPVNQQTTAVKLETKLVDVPLGYHAHKTTTGETVIHHNSNNGVPGAHRGMSTLRIAEGGDVVPMVVAVRQPMVASNQKPQSWF